MILKILATIFTFCIISAFLFIFPFFAMYPCEGIIETVQYTAMSVLMFAGATGGVWFIFKIWQG